MPAAKHGAKDTQRSKNAEAAQLSRLINNTNYFSPAKLVIRLMRYRLLDWMDKDEIIALANAAHSKKTGRASKEEEVERTEVDKVLADKVKKFLGGGNNAINGSSS